MKALQFATIILLVVSCVPGGAHLMELPNKIGLDREQYFIVQQIYRSWALAGIPMFAALVATLALAVLSRSEKLPCLLAAASFVLLLLSLISFFIWVFPTNQATDNWTTAPENWRALRARWEYAHAVNALITFAALASAVLSALAWRGKGRRAGRPA